jgi:hypothetical protein
MRVDVKGTRLWFDIEGPGLGYWPVVEDFVGTATVARA